MSFLLKSRWMIRNRWVAHGQDGSVGLIEPPYLLPPFPETDLGTLRAVGSITRVTGSSFLSQGRVEHRLPLKNRSIVTIYNDASSLHPLKITAWIPSCGLTAHDTISVRFDSTVVAGVIQSAGGGGFFGSILKEIVIAADALGANSLLEDLNLNNWTEVVGTSVTNEYSLEVNYGLRDFGSFQSIEIAPGYVAAFEVDPLTDLALPASYTLKGPLDITLSPYLVLNDKGDNVIPSSSCVVSTVPTFGKRRTAFFPGPRSDQAIAFACSHVFTDSLYSSELRELGIDNYARRVQSPFSTYTFTDRKYDVLLPNNFSNVLVSAGKLSKTSDSSVEVGLLSFSSTRKDVHPVFWSDMSRSELLFDWAGLTLYTETALAKYHINVEDFYQCESL